MYLSAPYIVLTSTAAPTTIWSWSEDQLFADKLKILQTVVSSLSIFGSLTIIFTYFIFQDLQSTARKFLVYISFGDFFTVFPYLVKAWVGHERHDSHDTINCKVQSFVTTTAVMWSFFWTSSLAIYLYLVLVRKNQERADKIMPLFHIINWGVPLALVGAAWTNLGSNNSGDSGGWCWISDKIDHNKRVWWMLACGKLCEILSYFIDVMILCFIVTRKISAEVSTKQGDLVTQTAMQGKRKLIWAPCLFVLLRIWGTIRFLLFCFNVKDKKYIYNILIVLHIIGDSSQGFVYFILFCLWTPKFRENVYRMFCNKKKRVECKGRSLKKEEHKYLLQNPKSIVFYT